MTTQDRARTRGIAPTHIAFRKSQKRQRPDFQFSKLHTQPTYPLFTLRSTPHGAIRKTRSRVVRYSFLVGLSHSLLHAGLSRRTAKPCFRQLTLNFRIARHPTAEPVPTTQLIPVTPRSGLLDKGQRRTGEPRRVRA
jgi:hypothetical protein